MIVKISILKDQFSNRIKVSMLQNVQIIQAQKISKTFIAQWSGGRKLAKLSYVYFWTLTFIFSVEKGKIWSFEPNLLIKNQVLRTHFHHFFKHGLIYVVKKAIFGLRLTKSAQRRACLTTSGMFIEPYWFNFQKIVREKTWELP